MPLLRLLLASAVQHPSPEQLDEMARLGQVASPRETGGVLLAGVLIEMPNQSSEEDLYSFLIDDLEQVIGDATIDEVLFWHTHPGGNIGPSKYDLERRLEGFQYMVVALTPEGPVPARY